MATGGSEKPVLDYASIPIDALNVSVRRVLSEYLNPPLAILSPCGVVRDWRGVAELREFTYQQIVNFERLDDPTAKLLDEWNSNGHKENSVQSLLEILEALSRFDILDEIATFLERDCLAYLRKREKYLDELKPPQVNIVSTCMPDASDCQTDHHVDEDRFIVRGDDQYKIATFDAFVCFNGEKSAVNDWAFVRHMSHILENPPHNLRLYIMHRDLLPGTSTLNVSATLIEKRCKRTIIILSQAYLGSPECEFMTRYALCLSPSAHSKKILPIRIEPDCPIPSVIRPVSVIDYTREDLHEWFWDRIAAALKKPLFLTVEDRTSKEETNRISYTLTKKPNEAIMSESNSNVSGSVTSNSMS